VFAFRLKFHVEKKKGSTKRTPERATFSKVATQSTKEGRPTRNLVDPYLGPHPDNAP